MNKRSDYKIGCRVKRLIGNHRTMEPGDVGTIIDNFDELVIKIDGKGTTKGHDYRNFEILTPCTYSIY